MVRRTTEEIHQGRIRYMMKSFDIPASELMTNPRKTVALVKAKWPNVNSRASYITSLQYLAREMKLNADITQIFKDARLDIGKNQDIQLSNNFKTEVSIDWPDIIAYREELRSTATNKTAFQDYLIMSLYTYIPPVRLDYNNLEFTDSITKCESNPNQNFVVISPNKPAYICLNTYKTVKQYGPVKIGIPPQLGVIINHWMKNYNSTYPNVWKMSQPALGEKISRILTYKFGFGSLNSLRHSYLTHVYADLNRYSNAQLEQISRIMGNSVETALKTYRQVDEQAIVETPVVGVQVEDVVENDISI